MAKSYVPSSGRRRRERAVVAVEEVDLEVGRGETLALVGESGAGKSTVLMEIVSLAAPEAGVVEILGQDVSRLTRRTARLLRGAVQIVPQDPMSSLDPRMPVGDIVAEPLHARRVPREVVASRIPRLLRQVGLDAGDAERYPHQFSGGQRQRVAIARALAVEPSLLLLDEPVSALDVSVQAQILDLLLRLKRELGPAYLLVSHDLAVVRQIADRVSVMYAGRTVETGPVDEIFDAPRHPYARALLSAVPLPDPVAERARRRIVLPGDPRPGCRSRRGAGSWPAARSPRCSRRGGVHGARTRFRGPPRSPSPARTPWPAISRTAECPGSTYGQTGGRPAGRRTSRRTVHRSTEPEVLFVRTGVASAAGTARTAGLRDAFAQGMGGGTRTVQPESARHKSTDEDDDCYEREYFDAHENLLSEHLRMTIYG